MIIESNQIKEWVKRAYDNAVKHGWHNENKSNAHWLMMVCTEVAEAVQADRKGRYMNDLDKEGLRTVLANDNGGKLFDKYYSDTIEGKVESELADICIRIFDFNFNSIKVRLEPYHNVLNTIKHKFQFHKGTIRTRVLSKFGREYLISIP